MDYPTYSNAEFVSQTAFNTGTLQLVSGIYGFPSNSVFFKPGLLNTSSLSITLNTPSNLDVTVNAPSPFTILFSSGAYASAYGTTNGSSTTSYVVNFASLVPGSGSVTAYLVAAYGTILQDPYTVVGPPIGHPDYNPTFQPYIAYATTQETLVLTATTTAPDNLTTFEIGRTTLTSGQTSLSSINTTNQVPAQLIISPSTPINGDVTGTIGATTISKLQGKTVSAGSPVGNQVLQYNGSTWVPGSLPSSLPPSGSAGGDLYNTYPNPNVGKIRGITVNSTSPTDQQVATYVAASTDIEWKTPPRTIQSTSSVSLANSVVLNPGSMVNIVSISVTMPSTVGNYRVDLRWNEAIQNSQTVTFSAGLLSQITDGSNIFGHINGSVNANGASHVEGMSGTCISPAYTAGSNITFTLQTEQLDFPSETLTVLSGSQSYINAYVISST